MNVKRMYPYRTSFLASIIGIVVLLASNGCFFFGGGEEELQVTEPPQPDKGTMPVPQKPSMDESRLQDRPYDAIEQIETMNPDGQTVVTGSLNWSSGVIRAAGFGKGADRFSALTAARTVAEANLLGIIKGVNIDSKTTVENAMLKDQTIVRVIQGVLRGAIVGKEEFNEADQTAVVEVVTGLENVAEAIPEDLIPPQQHVSNAFEPHVSPAFYTTFDTIDPDHTVISEEMLNADPDEVQAILAKLDQQDETIQTLQAELDAYKKAKDADTTAPAKPYTGIVINASGLGVKEALYPKIYYRDGDANKLLYGDTSQNRPREQVYIWAGWAKTLGDAKLDSKVADNPLIILQPVGLTANGDVVISAQDAEKIQSLEQADHLLEQGKVVIVL